MKIGLRQDSRSAGLAFTLAEVLIAVAIVSISFVSLYAGVFFAFSVTRFERENLRATQIMLERMEGIRLFNWYQLTNTAMNPPIFYERYYPGTAGVGTPSGIIYTGQVNVANANLAGSTYSADVKKVTITVRWTSGNVPRTRSFSTFAAKNGVQNYVYSSSK